MSRRRGLTITRDEAGKLLDLAARLFEEGQRADSELLERIASKALMPRHRPTENIDRDVAATLAVLSGEEKQSVIAARLGLSEKQLSVIVSRNRKRCEGLVAERPALASMVILEAYLRSATS